MNELSLSRHVLFETSPKAQQQRYLFKFTSSLLFDLGIVIKGFPFISTLFT